MANEPQSTALRVFAAMYTAVRAWELLAATKFSPSGVPVFPGWLMLGAGTVATVFGSRVALIIALTASLQRTWTRIPCSWDNEFWDAQTDLAMISCLSLWLASGSTTWFDRAQIITRRQYACFYAAAGFWKLNAAFFDPTASCASLFLLQHLAKYGEPLMGLSPALKLAPAVAMAAPYLTVALELAVGVGMLTSPRVGATLALALHALISATPPPNNISSFSCKCVARLLLFAEPAAIDRVARRLATPLAILGPIYVGILMSQKKLFRGPQDVATALFAPEAAIVALALAASASSKKEKKHTVGGNGKEKTFTGWILATGFVAVAAFYSFATLPLGLQDLGSPAMYANLKVTGGSNHFFLPTSVLPRRLYDDPTSVFYGGVIRLEATNSSFVRRLYPGDQTPTVTPASTLSVYAPSARYDPPAFYHPAKARVLGIDTALPESAQHWVPFTLPAFELRRLVAEIRSRGEACVLRYARLPGVEGDELWRATAVDAIVEATFDATGRLVECTTTTTSSTTLSQPCGPDELVNLPPLPWLATKLVLYLPYPVQFRETDSDGSLEKTPLPPPNVQCFGP